MGETGKPATIVSGESFERPTRASGDVIAIAARQIRERSSGND
jgi:hypothetical protein